MIVYVVVTVGETILFPEVAEAPKLDETTLSAFTEVQAKVVLCPLGIVVGVAPS